MIVCTGTLNNERGKKHVLHAIGESQVIFNSFIATATTWISLQLRPEAAFAKDIKCNT